MRILSIYDPEPAQNLRPKMARINMIGASGGSETPTPAPQGVTSASEGVPVEQQHWRCEICKGNWYETNEMGADWMINKVQFLMRKTGALSHECDACTGVTWDGGHEKRGTETGLYWAGNTPWVFKGFATEWVSARKVYSRPIDRPLWTPPPKSARLRPKNGDQSHNYGHGQSLCVCGEYPPLIPTAIHGAVFPNFK
jgi:hypothetical protein